jgi:hypothetical protein
MRLIRWLDIRLGMGLIMARIDRRHRCMPVVPSIVPAVMPTVPIIRPMMLVMIMIMIVMIMPMTIPETVSELRSIRRRHIHGRYLNRERYNRHHRRIKRFCVGRDRRGRARRWLQIVGRHPAIALAYEDTLPSSDEALNDGSRRSRRKLRDDRIARAGTGAYVQDPIPYPIVVSIDDSRTYSFLRRWRRRTNIVWRNSKRR